MGFKRRIKHITLVHVRGKGCGLPWQVNWSSGGTSWRDICARILKALGADLTKVASVIQGARPTGELGRIMPHQADAYKATET